MSRPASRRLLPSLTRLLCAGLVLLLLLCGEVAHAQSEESEIDILVVYTRAAKELAGGETNIETRIEEMVASTNTAFRTSGVNIRLRLVHVEELDYVEPRNSDDFGRLQSPSDGHMDEVHALRTAVGADLVHLIERWGVSNRLLYCGIARVGGGEAHAFGSTVLESPCGSSSITFAHEVGHNFGLMHDRYTKWSFHNHADNYGYVNQAMFQAGAPAGSRWYTIMAYSTQCAGRFSCSSVNRFSNPDQTHTGNPLGVPDDSMSPETVGPVDARRTLNAQRAATAVFRTPPTTPTVASLKRRSPAVETTNADELRWRLAFNMDVQNVDSTDFEVEGLTTPTVTVTAKTGSQRIYDITVTGGGLDDLTGTVTLGFASDQDITKLNDTETTLDTTWPAAAQQSYSLDNTAPQPTISPSAAGSTPFTAIIRFDKDVTGFDAAGDVTATSASVAAPVRADARTYTVQVTPNTGATTITVTVGANKASDALGNGNATATGEITYDTMHAKSLTVSGLADVEVAENAAWTSAVPTLDPVGTVTWLAEGTDADHFTIDASNGVLSLAAQDFESPADANTDHAYEVTVRAVDASGNAATQAISVTVTDAVENIDQAIGIGGNLKVWENVGFRVSPYLAKKPVGEEKAWEVTGADATHFKLSDRTIYGVKSYYLEMPIRDYENPVDANTDNVYEVTLTALGDDDGNPASKDLRVEVIDRPEIRTLRISGLSNTTVQTNRPYTSARPTVSGKPVGQVTWTTEGTDAYQFTIGARGVLRMAAQDYANPVDRNGDNVYEVTVRVTDEDDNTATRDLRITVASSTTRGGGSGGSGGSGGGGGGSSGGGSRDDHGNSSSRATRIQPSGRTAGQINTTRDVDYFTLTAPQAGIFIVETTGSTDTRGTVWQDGQELATAASGGAGQNFRLTTQVEAGPVVVAVRGNGRQTGRYTLQTTVVAYSVENPQPGSFQSGLGVISGWVCEGEAVTIEIERAKGAVVELEAAYGTERADTAGICGDEANGFGLLFNWNLLGDGTHEVVVLVDGSELGRAPVTVTTLGAEFRTGLQGSFVVANFPRRGEQLQLVWQEAGQNFVLAPTELGAASAPARVSGAIEGVLENPTPASYQSGLGVISGWVCETEEVVIEVDGQPIAAAAGTERADTLDRCGDVDNGFGLLVNWAEFGAGAHEVVARVDGVELSRATVTVTVVDETEPYVRGLAKRVELPGFPTPEETVTVEWQQTQQNFVITGLD